MKKLIFYLSIMALGLGLMLGGIIGYTGMTFTSEKKTNYVTLAIIISIIFSRFFLNERNYRGIFDKGLSIDSFLMIILGWGYAYLGAIITGGLAQCLQGIPFNISTLQQIGVFEEVEKFFTTVLIVPIGEEIFFRGILIRELDLIMNTGLAVIISSLIFLLVHFDHLQSPNTFLMGIILSLVYYFRVSLTDAIIVHAVNNFFAVFITLSRTTYEFTLNYGFICMILSVFIMIYIMFHMKQKSQPIRLAL